MSRRARATATIPAEHLGERRLLLRPRHRQERRLRPRTPVQLTVDDRHDRLRRRSTRSAVAPAGFGRVHGQHADPLGPRPDRAATEPARRTLSRRGSTTLGDATDGASSTCRPIARIDRLNAQAGDNPAASTRRTSSRRASATSSRRTAIANLKYVVLVGGDSSIPFFRYPDPADLAPESWYVPPVAGDLAVRGEPSLGLRARPGRVRGEHRPQPRRDPLPDAGPRRRAGSSRPPPKPRRCSTPTYRRQRATLDRDARRRSLVTGYDFIDGLRRRRRDQLTTGMGTGTTHDTLINDTLDRRPAPGQAARRDPLRPRVPGRPLRRQRGCSRPTTRPRSTRPSSPAPTVNLDEHPRLQHGLPRGLQHRRRATASPASPRRSTGPRPSPARARRSSPARASSTAMTSSSSTASGSTPSSPISSASATARSRSARRSSSRSSPTSPRPRRSRACTRRRC